MAKTGPKLLAIDNCARTRIEILFAMLKQLLGAFHFRFWSKKLPCHSRRPTANRDLKAPRPEHRPTVAACWQAYETFVLCASIALGLLQLIARRFGPQVWQHHTRYLRTQSRALPSERTVKQVLAALLVKQLVNLPSNRIISKIGRCLAPADEDAHQDHRSVA